MFTLALLFSTARSAACFASLPAGWSVGERAAPSEGLTLHVFLSHQPARIATLTASLDAAADSTNAAGMYGDWLSFDAVNDLTTPAPQTTARVERWLSTAGIDLRKTRASAAGDIIEVYANVTTVEALLPGAKYYVLRHAKRGLRILRTASHTLPTSIAGSVDFVAPTSRVPTIKRTQTPRPRDAAAATVGPPGLRARYGATGVRAAASTNSSFAVVGFLDQYFDPTDITWFFNHYDKAVSSATKVGIHGPNKPSTTSSGEEATLDVSYGAAMAAGVPTTFWSTAGRQPGHAANEPFAQWLMDLASDPAPPLVFSISYSDDEYTVDSVYAQRVNVEMQKAGIRGISIISSSGDGGVGGTQPNQRCKHFLPTFPASSPFVTAVGGTAATASGPTASAVFPSGGGFSNLFPQPAYQAIPVAQYLAKGAAVKLPSGTLFNSSGKAAAYPDVALLAENFVLSQYKVPVPVSGTSCSTPAFAALVALLNSERLAAGKPSLGYLNPLLYANPGAFTDVVKGSNPGCAVNPSVGYLGTGFECAAGWDPLTGLGTPLFKKWQAIVSALP